MFKYQIRLDTGTDIKNFIQIAEQLPYDVNIQNEDGIDRGTAKTLLNVMDAISYGKIYVISQTDMYTPFARFIVSAS